MRANRTHGLKGRWWKLARFAGGAPLTPAPAQAREETPFQGYRSLVGETGLGLEFYFARQALPADAPVHVFQHTMKTGGTSVRALLYVNLSDEYEFVPRPSRKWSDDFAEQYRAVYSGLSGDERARLVWAVSHSAAHLIPLLERPVRPLTIVREPIDRTLSRFWFGGPKARSKKSLETLRSYFSKARMSSRGEYANPQSRWLLRPYFDVEKLKRKCGPPPDADEWRERLFGLLQDYVLLLQDRLDESIRRLARDQGWLVASLPHIRRNPARPSVDDVDPELRERILGYNWLDLELYRHAVQRFEQEKDFPPASSHPPRPFSSF